MKDFLLGLCWWAMLAAMGYGHFWNHPWLFDIGLITFAIMMLMCLCGACCMMLSVFIPQARSSVKDIETVKHRWSAWRKFYHLIRVVVMVALLASMGWIFTAVSYFMIMAFTWLCAYLLIATIAQQNSLYNRL